MTDYEKVFQEEPAACGDPYPEFVEFFRDADRAFTILDLGSGQGRDAIQAAVCGHSVRCVELSPTGVRQTNERAAELGLDVRAEVGDLRTYQPSGQFDVVVLDRVVHMLKQTEEKQALLSMAQSAVGPAGYLLLADVPSNLTLIEGFFDAGWTGMLARKGLRFYRRST